jgi:hypothetical protein
MLSKPIKSIWYIYCGKSDISSKFTSAIKTIWSDLVVTVLVSSWKIEVLVSTIWLQLIVIWLKVETIVLVL